MVKPQLATFALLTALAIAQPPSAQPPPAADPRTLATVEGIILGGDRRPLPGATVTLMNNAPANRDGLYAPSHETTSDAIGRFSFQGLEPGEYMLTAEHAGYFTPFGGLFKPVTLTTGQHMTDVVLQLVPEPVLSGKVTDENGDPMPGVTVRPMHLGTENGRLRLGSVGTSGWNYGFQTGADGEFRLTIDGNLAGRWYLSFSANPDWGKTAIKSASAKPASNQPAPSESGSTEKAASAGLREPATASVSGSVASEKAAPEEPERDYVTTYYPGVRELSLASGIDVASGEQVTGLNMRLQKSSVYHVRGKVAGPIPPDLRITAFDEAGDAHALFGDEGPPIRADGTFSIAGLTPGAWTLILRQSSKQPFLGSRTVQVGDSDVEDVVIPVELPVDLRGSVKTIEDPSGATPPSVNPGRASPSQQNPSQDRNNDSRLRVLLEPLGPRSLAGPFFVRAENDGAFILKNVPANWYRVDLSLPGSPLGSAATLPPGGFVKSVTFDGRECIDSGIDLRGAGGGGAGSPGFEGSRLQITVSMTAGEIKGSVMNPDGGATAAMTRAMVTLMPDRPPTALYRPELHQMLTTDASGQFVFSNVVPGSYHVYAWERLPIDLRPNQPPAYADPEFLKVFDGVSVTVAESESKQVTLNLISAAKMDDEIRRHR
jgi:hypothetical protein